MSRDFNVDFICIGPERSGTTWLYECLKEHPEICVSEPKEVNFFNTSQSFWRKDLAGTTNYTKGLEWYKKHFKNYNEKKVVGEFTPIYLHSPEVPERIFKYFPNVKLIAILRNPAERLYSHYTYTSLKGFYELPSFEEVIRKENDFVEESAYYKHLQNYLKFFPKENILITIYEDIEKDPKRFIREVLQFIGADDSFISPSVNTIINPAGAVAARNKILSIKDRIKKIPGGQAIIDLFKKTSLYAKTLSSIATKTGTIKGGYGKIDPDSKKKLLDFYNEDIHYLEQFIHRDLSMWKK